MGIIMAKRPYIFHVLHRLQYSAGMTPLNANSLAILAYLICTGISTIAQIKKNRLKINHSI
jgi:hypothetical protein